LIPSFYDDQTPPGEIDVFRALASAPEDWVILHSLDLAPWNKQRRTEIDFVIIIPNQGILCVEVKSHSEIDFTGDFWVPASIKRSPFKQAVDGSQAFYRALVRNLPSLSYIPVTHICVFPRASFSLTKNISINSWELIDKQMFCGFKTPLKFCAALESSCSTSISNDPVLKPLKVCISKRDVKKIVEMCLPVRRRVPEVREEILERQKDMEQLLRQQQKPLLHLGELNPRMVVNGPAGTGKTLVALELATRMAERGLRVGLFCFNRLIGEWLKSQLKQYSHVSPCLVAGPAIQVLIEMADIDVPKSPESNFWDYELPELLEDAMTRPDFNSQCVFDYLIIDEAQDVLGRPWLWQCLGSLVNGHFNDGRYAIFGDFDFQVLNHRELVHETLEQLNALGRPARWELKENCRNYRIIGDTALSLAGLPSDVYTDFSRIGGGINDYDVGYYQSDAEQSRMVKRWISQLQKEGYQRSEITLLSFGGDSSKLLSAIGELGVNIMPVWRAAEQVGHTSVNAFKGMENKAIILTAINLRDISAHRDLFYTGLTRATDVLRLLLHKDSAANLKSWLLGE
jgi:hypothetical protein